MRSASGKSSFTYPDLVFTEVMIDWRGNAAFTSKN